MIQTLNPYPSKTDEIMSRYRPIAPKPEIPLTNNPNNTTTTTTTTSSYDCGPLVPEKFRQSPYLRNIWSHLQARPTRTRKRGRTAGIPATMLKNKQLQHKMGFSGPGPVPVPGSGPGFIGLCSPSPATARNLSFQAFALYSDHLDVNASMAENNNNNSSNINNNSCCMVTLPLLSSATTIAEERGERKGIDLNAVEVCTSSVLEERDLLLQLQVPSGSGGSSSNSNGSSSSSSSSNYNNVISPRPVRPVGSSISVVGPISEDPSSLAKSGPAEVVEEAAEAEALPAVITDRSNKVRLANSAYKELVGQPECLWLDSMAVTTSGKRISGEVVLRLSGPDHGLPVSGNGFSCWVRIEWESEGKKKNSVNAFCDVVRLACESKDYLFSWRFHTREISPSGSKV